MITKYRVGGNYSNKIEKREVQKETECFIVLESGRKETKQSDYSNWFNTEREAKEFVLERMRNKYESIQRQISNYKKELEQVDLKIQQYIEDNPELGRGVRNEHV